MSLPNEAVRPLLEDFELTWKNIKKEDYVGYSMGYHVGRCAVGTTNGAGAHNTQMIVLSPAKVVMHALPGFWHPEDLARELRLAKSLYKLWRQPGYTVAQKKKIFSRLQLNAVRQQPAVTFARSTWQGFDSSIEARKDQKQKRDTFFDEKAPANMPRNLGQLVRGMTTLPVRPGQKVIKPINLLVHERMAKRPFVAWQDFDVASFVDYGNMHYDLNRGRDGAKGKTFPGQARLRAKRFAEMKKQRLAERRGRSKTRTD